VVDHACEQRWTLTRICGVLQIDPSRVWRWCQRVNDRGEAGLADRLTRAPVHGLTPHEEAEILAVAADWKDIDRSHRKLAHRGSYEGRVWASPSTFRKVIAANDVDLPASPPPAPTAPITPVPSWVAWEPGNVWMYDTTHFTRAGRAAVAIEDVVSRKWLATVLSVEETSTQVEVAFTRALAAEGLDDVIADRLDAPPDRADGSRTPVLLAWSDNGPQMTSADTRSFMALHLIAQHFGRPGTPADQGWIESLFGHTKTEAPYLTKITDPGVLWHELEARRAFYNHVRLHAGVGYVTPDDEHCGRGPAIRQARHDGLAHARQMRLQYHRNKQ
jgi:putative transposase